MLKFLLYAKTHKYRDFFRGMKVKKCQKNVEFSQGNRRNSQLIKDSKLKCIIEISTVLNHTQHQ